MKFKLLLFTGLLVSIGCAQTTVLKTGDSTKSTQTAHEARTTRPSWDAFLKFHDDVVAKHKKLTADKDKVIISIGELAELASGRANLEGADFAKLDEAEKSIRTKKANEDLEKYYKKHQALSDAYGLPFGNLLGRAAEIAESQQKDKKSKSKITFGTPWVVKKAFAEVEDIEKANYSGNVSDKGPFIKPSCVGADRKFNQNCLKQWINACAKTYKSENKTLYVEGVGEDWNKSEIKVENAAQYPSHKVRGNGADDVSDDEIINTWGFGLVFNACGWLSSQGYDFSYKGTYYPTYDMKSKWDEIAAIHDSGNLTAEKFNKICPRNPNQIAKVIKAATSEARIWKNLKDLAPAVLQITKGCEKSVHALCADVARANDKFSIYYPTKSCDIRTVTVADVEADLKSWADNEYITEAAKQGHLEMKNRLEICEAANELGYSWEFTAPKVDKDCKPPKK